MEKSNFIKAGKNHVLMFNNSRTNFMNTDCHLNYNQQDNVKMFRKALKKITNLLLDCHGLNP